LAVTKDIVEMAKVDSLDVLEWAMEMRENDMKMEIHNLQVKEIKQMEDRVKRQSECEARKDIFNQSHEQILDHEKCLKVKEAEIKERSAILEISLRLNE
jgi:hypothetical protein